MSTQQNILSKGDWIVHVYHGVGQVQGRDKRTFQGEKQMFIRVEISDGLYWLPVANTNADYIRPLASKDQIKQALNLIRRPPEKLPEDHNERGKEISERLKDVSLNTTAGMIRDLYARRVSARLNTSEENAFRKTKNQFLNEWSVINGEGRGVLEKRLDDALKIGIENIPIEEV
ncbi:MAG: hypothetical protein MUO76_14735 [Anaerolineaceae bacterium]|nr:hypothetical protein [Anaerolineaceae bacterium]